MLGSPVFIGGGKTTVWRIADGLGTRPSKLLAGAERILDEE
jgi:hypothetical protein